MALEPDAIYDEKETSRITGLSQRTLQRGRADAAGPPYVRLGKVRIGYTGRAILQWLEANTHRSVAAELAAQNTRKATAPA
jgi:predicted DNA-binding transcriptional regulator AlpA